MAMCITDALWKLLNPFGNWGLDLPSVQCLVTAEAHGILILRNLGCWWSLECQQGLDMCSLFFQDTICMLAIPTIFTSHTPEVGPFDLHLKCFILFPKILEHLGAFLKKASFIWPISHIILSGCPPCQAFSLLTSQGIAIGQPSCPNSRPPGWSWKKFGWLWLEKRRYTLSMFKYYHMTHMSSCVLYTKCFEHLWTGRSW